MLVDDKAADKCKKVTHTANLTQLVVGTHTAHWIKVVLVFLSAKKVTHAST